jgi:hypothetical protein
MADPVSLAIMGISTALSAKSSYDQGKAKRRAGEDEAQQYYRNAQRQKEAGERDAAEQRRLNRIAISDARARLASGGGSTTDPNALTILGRTAGANKYNELAYLYDAQLDSATSMRAGDAAKRGGQAAGRAGTLKSLSTAISGGHDSYQGFQAWKLQRNAATQRAVGGYAAYNSNGMGT